MAEDEAEEQAEILSWHALTSDPRWDLVMETAGHFLRAAHAACADPGLPEAKRLVAMGEVKAWSTVRTWRDTYRQAYDQLAAEKASEDEPEELVGSELKEQWYERRP